MKIIENNKLRQDLLGTLKKLPAEILNKLNLSNDETIMFGNDVLEDGASSKVDIDTILVVDCLVNSLNLPYEDFQKGTLEDVLEFCLSLEKNN